MAVLQFSRRYSMAHRLITGTSEKCAIPHGHNEVVTIELASNASFQVGGSNALSPFERVKGRWHRWIDDCVDHALQLNEADPLLEYFRTREPHRLRRIMTFPGDPTTEAQAVLFFLKLRSFLASDAQTFDVVGLRIEETPTNAVRVDRPFIDALALPTGWWSRADESINDVCSGPRLSVANPA